MVWHWLVVISGARNEGGGWYWHQTCHVGRCWRPGRHAVDGTPYRTCRRHHPGGLPRRVSREVIADAHRRRM